MEPLPDPTGEVFARGIFQPLDLIEIMMVESFAKRMPRLEQIVKINGPTRVRVHGTSHGDLHAKTVTVQARALVPGRDLRQAVSGFKTELMGEADIHRRGSLSRCAAERKTLHEHH